jgi:hypothetical protein
MKMSIATPARDRYDLEHTYVIDPEDGTNAFEARECLDCGLLAVNEVRHDHWHELLSLP